MLCQDSTAGVMNGLCEAINKHTMYSADFIQLRKNWLEYPASRDLHDVETQEWLHDTIKDVMVLHWNIFDWNIYLHWFDFRPYMKDKIEVKHFHGTMLRRSGKAELGRFKKTFVSTPDLLRYNEKYTLLPNPSYIPYDYEATMPEDHTWITHLPTQYVPYAKYMGLISHSEWYPQGWPPLADCKGTDIFKETMKDLSERFDWLKWTVPGKMTFRESIQYKSKITGYFSNLWAGNPGVNALESMQMKKAIYANISPYARMQYEDRMGEAPPLLQVERKTFHHDMKDHLRYADHVETGQELYKWVNKYHGQKEVAKFYVEEVLG